MGDIICFHSGDVYVTHRIKEITTDEEGNAAYITQGDANNAPDQGMVSADQIVGVYKTHWVGLGGVFMMIQSPVGIIVFFALPIILVLFIFIIGPLIGDALARRAQKNADGVGRDGQS